MIKSPDDLFGGSPVATSADYAAARRAHIAVEQDQDRAYRAQMRQVSDAALRGGPWAHLPTSIFWGAAIGAAIGAIRGPSEGESRVLKYAAWGAAIKVGLNLASYEMPDVQ